MKKAILIDGPVGKAITQMTVPLLGGIYAMITFTLVDTYFVSRLGTKALAAISFTYPVSMVLIYFILGVGVGTASLVARTIGQGDSQRVQRFATDGLLLGVVFIIFELAIGLTTIDPLFKFLGAGPEVLELIRDYMYIWYIAIAFFVISMIANNIIRAAGDAKFPSIVMMVSALINLILDPIFIFGYFGFPAMGIKGAAVATLIAFALSLIALIIKQIFHYHLITFKSLSLRECLESWRHILYIGVPSGLTNVIIYLAMAFIMKLLASFGETAVAGFGIAIRIEELGLAMFHAMGGAVAPFAGQNWGAKNYNRVKEGLNFSFKFCLLGGIIFAGILALFGKPIARIFDSNEIVIHVASLYMIIVPVTYALRGIIMMITTSLNALGKPIPATIISLIRTFVIYIPIAYLLKSVLGIVGIFAAAFLANALTGIGAFYWNRGYLNRLAAVRI